MAFARSRTSSERDACATRAFRATRISTSSGHCSSPSARRSGARSSCATASVRTSWAVRPRRLSWCTESMAPELLRGALAVDDRGEVGFVNEFRFDNVKRFYTVANHETGFVRAWHGHRREAKFVLVTSGAALVCCVEVDDWENPARDLAVQ